MNGLRGNESFALSKTILVCFRWVMDYIIHHLGQFMEAFKIPSGNVLALSFYQPIKSSLIYLFMIAIKNLSVIGEVSEQRHRAAPG